MLEVVEVFTSCTGGFLDTGYNFYHMHNWHNTHASLSVGLLLLKIVCSVASVLGHSVVCLQGLAWRIHA